MTDMENPSSLLISSDSSKSIVSNGAEASVIYTFDSSAGQNEKVACKVRKKSYCARHSCCVKCALCLLVVTALIFVALGSAMTMLARNLDLSSENITISSSRLDEFYESWEAPPEIQEKVRVESGKDRENRTVWFISFGQWDLGPLLEKNETKVELDTYVEQLHYRFRQSQEGPENENGTAVGWAMVVNMEGFTLGKAFDYNVIAYMQDNMKRYMRVLETFDYAVVINIPSWSRFIIELVRPFWGTALDRFEMHGYEDWLAILLERISADQLPEGYGSYIDDDTW